MIVRTKKMAVRMPPMQKRGLRVKAAMSETKLKIC